MQVDATLFLPGKEMKVIPRTTGNAHMGYFLVTDMCKRMCDLLGGSPHDCNQLYSMRANHPHQGFFST